MSAVGRLLDEAKDWHADMPGSGSDTPLGQFLDLAPELVAGSQALADLLDSGVVEGGDEGAPYVTVQFDADVLEAAIKARAALLREGRV